MQPMIKWLTGLAREILGITYDLFKLMIPVIILVKLIEELGGIDYISAVIGPVMKLVGLPASMGLVWATTMIVNIYGGMIIFVTMPLTESLSVAQVTVLGTMMLVAHSLPIEGRIAQKAGIGLLYTLVLRIVGALVLGFILHHIYSSGNFLSQSSEALWKPAPVLDDSLQAWSMGQLVALFQVFVIIAILVVFLRGLKWSGIENLFARLLLPVLRFLGLGERTTSITIIGMTLGLTYGGGLLINEAKKGDISKRDIFGSMSLLAVCHSLIEDTLLIVLIGGDLTGILFARVVFAALLIALIMRLLPRVR
ncbi:MAG: hypothetical protein GY927_09875 [bacterium]|nr:hypothetical protein [bacterium]